MISGKLVELARDLTGPKKFPKRSFFYTFPGNLWRTFQENPRFLVFFFPFGAEIPSLKFKQTAHSP